MRALEGPSRLMTRLRRDPPAEQTVLLLLVALATLITVLGETWSTELFPPAELTLPLLFGGLMLARKALRQLAVFVVLFLVFDLVQLGWSEVRPGSMAVVAITGLVAHEFARSREETGLSGMRSDSVLLELKRRLALQGEIRALPAPWRAESVVRPAGGGPFAGDFVVSCLEGHQRFNVALVDVSGKGVEAGTRSLLLSGALGGLLADRSPEGFLTAANAYLVSQDWDEGFATAVHLTIDLATGAYAAGSAGHPPAAHFDAGSGRWSLIEGNGPALGLLPGASYATTEGLLRPGDALLLYTDGLVEVPGRDLSVGIDKLLGEAERLVPRGFAGGGEVLVNRVSAGSADDRGLVLVWRSAQ
ncbi:MAG: serine phosphatase [Frankiales bacterium]|nr:serine phosphatase [Frankiales bacterium]